MTLRTSALPADGSQLLRHGRRAAARLRQPDVIISVGGFVAMCIVVLVRRTALLEPDDYAYRASIVALAHGHITLSTTQFNDLSRQLGSIAQWVKLPDGRWISEKNPGYPFFAVPFQLIGALRLAPLFYGALACVGLFFGARRWLGGLAGAWAVILYCFSGAALVFAWRDTMATFTDTSLAAAGVGALLWTMLAREHVQRRRAAVGLLGFLALEGATFVRYTDVAILVAAILAVGLTARWAEIGRRTLVLWAASVAALCGVVAAFDDAYYGGIFKTGYRAGEVSFAFGSISGNVQQMPRHLVWTMPLLVLALVGAAWIAVRAARHAPGARVDGAIGLSLFAGWLGIYGLYAAYAWTVSKCGLTGATLSLIRFYLPALGCIALLAAWLVARLPRWATLASLAAVVTLAGVVYPRLADAGILGGTSPNGPVPCLPSQLPNFNHGGGPPPPPSHGGPSPTPPPPPAGGPPGSGPSPTGPPVPPGQSPLGSAP